MTIKEEARDYKAYLAFLKYVHIPYPVPEHLRPVLDGRIKAEYELIQKKNGTLPARLRRVVCRIVELSNAPEFSA